MSNHQQKNPLPTAWLFTVIFAIALACTGAEYWRIQSLQQHLGQQTGLVTAVEENVIHRKSGWKDGVQASFSAGGQSYTVDSLRAHGSVSVGGPVNVVYDQRDPARSARIGEPGDIWLGLVPPAVVAGLLGFMSAILWGAIISAERAKARAAGTSLP